MTSSLSSKPRTLTSPSAKRSAPAACHPHLLPSPFQGCLAQAASVPALGVQRWIRGPCRHVLQQVGTVLLGLMCTLLSKLDVCDAEHSMTHACCRGGCC
jgi:hypothetical protein